MIGFQQLCTIASHKERVTSRQIARRLGLLEEDTLKETLEIAAAKAGLPGVTELGDSRAAKRAADADRLMIRRQKKAEERRLRLEKLEPPAGSWLGWFDGSTQPYPRRCSIGAILKGPGGERLEMRREVDSGSSNDAEYLACIALLELALGARAPLLTVHGDSQVVIGDLTAAETAASLVLRPHRLRAQSVMVQLAEVRFRWIPRHKNAEADALSRAAL